MTTELLYYFDAAGAMTDNVDAAVMLRRFVYDAGQLVTTESYVRQPEDAIDAFNENHDDRGRFAVSPNAQAKIMIGAAVSRWAGSNRDRQQMAETYRDNAFRVLDSMTPAAVEKFQSELSGVQFYRSFAELTAARTATDLEVKLPPGAVLGAVYDYENNVLHLDGGGATKADEIYAHEFSHVVDTSGMVNSDTGKVDLYSNTPEWNAAWRSDLIGPLTSPEPPLSGYAMTHPAEGFAEFGRALYVAQRDGDRERFDQTFPKATAFWRSRGLA